MRRGLESQHGCDGHRVVVRVQLGGEAEIMLHVEVVDQAGEQIDLAGGNPCLAVERGYNPFSAEGLDGDLGVLGNLPLDGSVDDARIADVVERAIRLKALLLRGLGRAGVREFPDFAGDGFIQGLG